MNINQDKNVTRVYSIESKEQYRIFEFVVRYYLYANGCKRRGKISRSVIENCTTHLRIKSYLNVKDDKGNSLDYYSDIAEASQNPVLSFAVNAYYNDKVVKDLHIEFTCQRDKIRSFDSVKNHIRSLRGQNRFQI